MFEAKVISAFLADRKDYDNVVAHIDRKAWSPMGTALLELIDNYYKQDHSAEKVDLEVYRVAIARRFKDIPKHQEKALDYLEEVIAADTSTINVVSEVINQQRADIGTQLADALLAQDAERIEMYLQQYTDLADTSVLEGVVDEAYTGVDLDTLEAQFDDDGAWRLAPKELDKRIRGGLRPGHAVILAARPERGKTLFGITMCAGFLEQGARALYIGNEDPIPDLVIRLISHLSGMTEEEMFANKEEAMSRARAKGYDSCSFVGLSPGTLYEIESLVRKYDPDVLIVDQMRNVRANTENNTQRLEVVAQELRNIARRHKCVLLAMTQVGDSGRDKIILNDGDIDGSNTGIPGACDVIVMVGTNEDFDKRNLRHLTLAKNKRGGNHDSFTVSINPALSRVITYAREA